MSQFGSGVWAVGGGASDFRDARLVFKSTLYFIRLSFKVVTVDPFTTYGQSGPLTKVFL